VEGNARLPDLRAPGGWPSFSLFSSPASPLCCSPLRRVAFYRRPLIEPSAYAPLTETPLTETQLTASR
jgi:hypothetical protein